MKHTTKSVIALFLCICMCISMTTQVFAANSEGVTYTATLDNDSLFVSNEEQLVTMTISTNKPVTLEAIFGTIVYDEPLELVSITSGDERIDFSGSVNTSTGEIVWDGTTTGSVIDQYENVTNLAIATFRVPAQTAAGTYNVGMEEIQSTRNQATPWETGASATASVTILENGYIAGLTTATPNPEVNDTVYVNVNVTHNTESVFAAGELELTYDSTRLTFDESGSTLHDATVTDSNGTLKLADYGVDKNLGNGVYVLAFTAIADGVAEVELTAAAFSNKTAAATQDLTDATISPATVTITIDKETVAVDLPEGFAGNETAVVGEDYTFTVADENYDYEVTATVSGEDVTVIDNGDGTYTIAGEDITGELVITAVPTPKTYNVTINGETASDSGITATYNTAYTFTLLEDVPAGQTAGTNYTLESITIDGRAYTGYAVSGRTYTIPGADITGDIVITVKATTVDPNQFAVEITGTGAGNASGADVVNKGETYALTLTPEAGYIYTVTATMGGSNVTVNQSGNTYTVANVTGKLVFTVTKTVDTSSVTVSEYLTVQGGQSLFLVKYTGTVAEGKVPTYDDQPMFKSEAYNAYCYLVFAATLTDDEAKANVSIGSGNATVLTATEDVNETGKVDANDAQLVYNMYNTVYSAFTGEVTMQKFLKADVNSDGIIDVNDAVAIINTVLGVNG